MFRLQHKKIMSSRVAISHLSFLNQSSRAHVRKKKNSFLTRASARLNFPFARAPRAEVNLKVIHHFCALLIS